MPGMETAITTLRERVDGPDIVASSRAAQNALVGSLKSHQQRPNLKVIYLTPPIITMLGMIRPILFLLVTSRLFLILLPLQEEEMEQSVDELAYTSHMPLELVPPSPALKLPYTSPISIGGFSYSKLALSSVSSMPSLDVLQEQEGMEGSGVFWNGGNDLAEGTTQLSYFGCVLHELLPRARY